MSEDLEIYVKEKNLLQLALFYFGRGRPTTMTTEWEDSNGSYSLKCVCEYGVPGAFDQDVYTAAMRVWIKQGMPHGCIKLTYTDIARELKFENTKNNIGRIKSSLHKLGQARYELDQCFVRHSGEQESNVQFSLFDAVILHSLKKGRKNKKFTELYFPDIIRENLEAKYYQRLDMGWYRALPSGLPRRLYEYLEKRRYHNVKGRFTISEEVLCRWLPIRDNHTTNRRKTLENIAQVLINSGYLSGYELDKKKKQCVFMYSKNTRPPQEMAEIETEVIGKDAPREGKLATEPIDTENQQLIFVQALDWINSIPYFHKKKRLEIASLPMHVIVSLYPRIRQEYERLTKDGETPRPSWVYSQFVKKSVSTKPTKKPPVSQQMDFLDASHRETEEIIEDLVKLMKTNQVSQKLRRDIEKYIKSSGYEYVKDCILYANENAKKKYSTYLQQTLAKNWAEEWAEEEKPEIEAKLRLQEEKQQEEEARLERERLERELERKAEKQRPTFAAMFAKLDKETKDELWDQAKAMEDQVDLPHKIKTTRARLAFANLVLKYFNRDGQVFVAEVISDMFFVADLVAEYSL